MSNYIRVEGDKAALKRYLERRRPQPDEYLPRVAELFDAHGWDVGPNHETLLRHMRPIEQKLLAMEKAIVDGTRYRRFPRPHLLLPLRPVQVLALACEELVIRGYWSRAEVNFYLTKIIGR